MSRKLHVLGTEVFLPNSLEFSIIIDESVTLECARLEPPHPTSPSHSVGRRYLQLFKRRFRSLHSQCHQVLDRFLKMCRCRQPSPTILKLRPLPSEFIRMVPKELHHHLVIITPPPLSFFPRLYGTPYQEQFWPSPADVWSTLRVMEESGVLSITIPPYQNYLTGRQRVQPGDLIFHQQVAYYIIKTIGELPPQAGRPEGTVMLEGRTQDRVCVIIFMPCPYVAPPLEFGEDEGESVESK